MIRFIDLTGQIYLDEEIISFAFFDTVTGKFCEFSGFQNWDNLEEFINDFDDKLRNLERFLNLIPEEIKAKIR
ncbi:hypothetical protein AP75_01970 [Kaistella haifensis DSM 19056]|uniref:Uncharacterized protein n=1 Tax=Kaistella haifensis DSM 19056 TaxID=1450526 RepID=A0A246BC65_9FLAO|nr:hypothetical protein [Kaistella haifensis]OWK99278.1 hypothetical protein AP75_01970 [Kaistella haifensis DSM 19056]